MAKGRAIFNTDICKGCGLCASVCPLKIIELNQTVINKKGFHPAHLAQPDKCIGCANCAIMCPDSVITVVRETK